MTVLHTARLVLQPFCEAHEEGLQAMNSRPEVMRFITGKPESPAETRASIERVQARWALLGYSWWAFVHRDTGRLAGAGAVQHLRREAEPPADETAVLALRANPLELGWRLHPDYWRQGLASEAAAEMARFAFETLAAPALLAVRDPANVASGRVMDRMGMRYRGLERWYGLSLATHSIEADAWRARIG